MASPEGHRHRHTFQNTKCILNEDDCFDFLPQTNSLNLQNYAPSTDKCAITELQLQDHIWKERETFKKMIVPWTRDDINSLINDGEPINMRSILLKNTLLRMTYDLQVLYDIDTKLLAKEVPLSVHADNRTAMRLDFLGVSTSAESSRSLILFELKKPCSTVTRECITELLAYASYFSSKFIGMNNNHYLLVLIAPIKETIVQYSILASMIFDRKHVLVLEPIMINDGLNTLKLRAWLPHKDTFIKFSNDINIFNGESFDIMVIAFNDQSDEKQWPERKLLDLVTDAAQQMESINCHGFVSYSHYDDKHLLPHILVQCQINPFVLAKLRTKKDTLHTFMESPEQRLSKCKWATSVESRLKNGAIEKVEVPLECSFDDFNIVKCEFPFESSQLNRYVSRLSHETTWLKLTTLFNDKDYINYLSPSAFRFTGLLQELFQQYIDDFTANSIDGDDNRLLYEKAQSADLFCCFLSFLNSGQHYKL